MAPVKSSVVVNRPGMSGAFISSRMQSWHVPAASRESFESALSGR